MSQPSPQEFAAIFEDDRRGAAILAYLVARFSGKIYVKGGHEADRQSCYNAGGRDVIEHIVDMINRAHGVDVNQEEQ